MTKTAPSRVAFLLRKMLRIRKDSCAFFLAIHLFFFIFRHIAIFFRARRQRPYKSGYFKNSHALSMVWRGKIGDREPARNQTKYHKLCANESMYNLFGIPYTKAYQKSIEKHINLSFSVGTAPVSLVIRQYYCEKPACLAKKSCVSVQSSAFQIRSDNCSLQAHSAGLNW